MNTWWQHYETVPRKKTAIANSATKNHGFDNDSENALTDDAFGVMSKYVFYVSMIKCI